ncbi:MAG TPA: MBL fold metallo-hydrolase [Streptosporangiaceae bacterium]
MTDAGPDYSIWVIEFAQARSPLGLLLHGQAGDRDIPYCFTVLRSAEHTILVDAGYADTGRGRELAREDGITVWRDPAELLARAGAEPADVDAILVTHAHFDHLGNVAAFPNATVYIQRREVEKWSWAVSLPRSMDWLKQGVGIDDLAWLLRLAGQGRLRLVDGPAADVFPASAWCPTSTRIPMATSTW